MAPVYLVLVLLVAALGALTDIRCGRVKNKHLIIATAAWIILVVCEYFFLHSSSVLTFSLALNVILAVITAIIFYLVDVWAPGDCKFYIVISLIFPMRAYVVRDGNIFPALDFVIYAFALGYIFLLASILTHKTYRINSSPSFNLKHALSILANTGTISLVNILLNTYAPEFFYANRMLCILSSAALICLLQNKADTARKAVGFIGLIYSSLQSVLFGDWLNVSLEFIGSILIASAVEYINNRTRSNTYREISGEEVKAGMILSFSTLWAMRKCIDPELPKTTTENRRSRITQRQADAVKTWCRNAGSNVVIVETMPFAPFISAAVVVQVLRFLLLGR